MPLGGAVASISSSKNFAELVWGNRTSWSMLAPPSPLPHLGATQAQQEFYEEAPQVPSVGSPISPQSDHCYHIGIIPGTNTDPCLHDRTIPVPPGDNRDFSALWHVFLAVCLGNAASATVGSSPCTAGPVTGQLFGTTGLTTLNLASSIVIGGTPTPLISAAAVEAAESAGIVAIIDIHVTLICPVQP